MTIIHHHLRIWTALLGCLCMTCALSAQGYGYLNFSTTEGLPSSETYQTYQDAQGHIWILTDNGLARFNGYEMEVFTTQNGLPANTVFRVTGSSNGKVWFLTEGNLICYYFGGKIHPFSATVNLDSLLGRKIPSQIAIDTRGQINIACTNGAYVVLDQAGQLVSTWKPDNCNLDFRLRDGRLTGVRVRTGKKRFPTASPGFPEVVGIHLPLIDTLFAIANPGVGYPWYCGDGSSFFAFSLVNTIHLFSPEVHYLKVDFGVRINNLYWDRNSILWVSTREGLYRCGIEDGKFHKELVPLPSQLISSIIRDWEGGYWVTTLDQGVFYLPSIDFQLVHLGDQNVSRDVRRLSGWGDYLVAATQGNEFFLLENGRLAQRYSLDNFRSFGDRIWNILPQEEHNSFLLAPQVNPLLELELDSQTVRERYPGQGIRPLGIGRSARHGLVGVRRHLYYMRGDSARISLKKYTSLREVIETSDGRLWASGRRGLYCYQDGQFQELGLKDTLLSGPITSIVELPGGMLLLASQVHGLLGYLDGQTFPIPWIRALTGYSVNHIFAQDKHRMWLATSRGVTLLQRHPGRWAVRHYSTRDGLASDEVHQVYANDNQVWAGTSKGLNTFDARMVHSGNQDAPLYLGAVRVNGKNTSRNAFARLDLNYWQNTIDLDFYAVAFRQMGKIKYRYRLLGLENSEVTSASTHVQYNQLPPGNYQFEVESSRGNGSWSAPRVLAEFTIALPWWRRWWFLAGSALLGLGLFYLVVSARVQRVQKQEQIRTRINELEKKALQAQMDPHFLFNSLNAIQSFLSVNETDKAEEYLADFARLIRLILENSRSSNVAFVRELELLEKYMAFESLRFAGRIQFAVEVAPGITEKRILLPPMLIQPFVENAVEHGLANKEGTGQVRLRFDLRGPLLFCAIEDNGIGRAQAAKNNQKRLDHSSAGMMITRERLQLLNQKSGLNLGLQVRDLHDPEGRPAGTIVELLIPYQTPESV